MGQRRSRSQSDRADPERRAAISQQIVQEMMAGASPVLPGQIYPVMPGNNGHHLEETIIEAINQSSGRKSIAAAWLGMSRTQLEARIAGSERLQECIADIRELRVDIAETQLDALVLAGSDKAAIFVLKTLGKQRGYAESKEVKHTHNMTLEAANEMASKFRKAFDQIRSQAADVMPSIEQQPARSREEALEEAVTREVLETNAANDEFGDDADFDE
jgi:hypothetical protein